MAENFFQLLLIEQLENLEVRNPRRFRQRENPFLEFNDREFIRTFRLSKELVESLVQTLRPYMQPQQRGTDLEPEIKILICLRFLASGSYQLDIGSNYHFKVSQSSVSRCIHEVVNAINQPEIFRQFVKWPQNIQELNEIRRGFFMKYDFPGIIGCIDCTHIAIFPPKIHDPVYPEYLYVNRKNYHSINVQLVYLRYHNLKILNVNALYPGSTHDSFVWSNSNVQQTLRTLHEAGNTDYFLLGDSGYPLRTWLLTPLEHEPQPNTPQARYDTKHKTIKKFN